MRRFDQWLVFTGASLAPLAAVSGLPRWAFLACLSLSAGAVALYHARTRPPGS